MSMPGMWELIVIFAIVMVFFGGKRLPGLGGAIGESIKNFKKGISGDDDDKKQVVDSSSKGKPETSNAGQAGKDSGKDQA